MTTKTKTKYKIVSNVPMPPKPEDLAKRRIALATRIATLKITHGIYQKEVAEEADMTESMMSLTLKGEKSRTLEEKLDRIEDAIERIVKKQSS